MVSAGVEKALSFLCLAVLGRLLKPRFSAPQLSGVQSIAGSLVISVNPVLVNLTGLETLTSLGALSVVDNEALTMEPMETWGVPDFRNWMERYPGCAVAPSMVAKLLVMKLFQKSKQRFEIN